MGILNTVGPDVKLSLDCEVKQGLNYSVSKQGMKTTIQWPIKNQSGVTVDLTGITKALVNIRTDSESSLDIKRVLGTIVTPPTLGMVSFELPKEIYSEAGIYLIDIGIYTDDNLNTIGDCLAKDPEYIQSGYVMLERTSFSSDGRANSKLPRIDEIKNVLNDYAEANTLLNEAEFSNSDIILALLQPIREFNETPPILRNIWFSCRSFPFLYEWTHATAAYLLKTAIHKYMRNKLLTTHGGVGGDDLNRNGEYMQLYQALTNDWMEWRRKAKYAMNAKQFVTSMNQSIYSFFPSDRVYTYPR